MDQLPVVLKRPVKDKDTDLINFPVSSYSYSSWTKFSTNPFMFKINNINGEYIDTTSTAANVLGKAMHRAMRAYLGGDPDVPTPADEGEAIKHGHAEGLKYLNAYSDGFIQFNDTIDSRAKLEEKYAFCFFEYLKLCDYKNVKEILIVERKLKHKVEVAGKVLPVALEGIPDVVYRNKKGRIVIDDHKFTSKFSDPESIDASKLIQAGFLYFLIYAETGEEPYSVKFREFKTTKNKDPKVSQLREFEMVYADTPMLFELFFRLYRDITDALLGKQVYIPNFNAFYDKEVSIIAYIQGLDVDEEKAKKFKEMRVDNITDFLKKKIQKDGSMKKYLEIVSQKFISGATLNYKLMKIEERIKMKLAEHGMAVEFEDKIVGGAVTMYRYEPSVGLKMAKIEAYVKDIEQVVQVSGIRVLAPIPNSGLIGFEVPNLERTFPKAKPKNDGFMMVIGQDILGKDMKIDIREAPHMLVAGTTGSGKSVFLNSMIHQIGNIPGAQLVLMDPKMVELTQFQDQKNVLSYSDQPREIADQLRVLTKLMNDRYQVLKKHKVRNIQDLPEDTMAYIFVVIDEYGDLMTSSKYGKIVEQFLLTLAQKARAAGIHLILTTQRPSVKIVTGEIKANFPTRIAFRTASQIDSHIILDQFGAEKLLGKGDMLLKTHESVTRLQGYFIK